MSGIAVKQKRGGPVPTGCSKLFGSPDVPGDFEWPAVTDSAGCYDLDFVCQLNCAELAPCDRRKLLPDTGMLYFFYDFAASPGGVGNRNAARVVYSPGGELEELVMVDAGGVDCALCPPKALSFSRLPKDAPAPRMLLPLSDDIEPGFTALFCLSSFRIEGGNVHFTDIGRLWFLIDSERLGMRDFADVRVKISE